MTYFREGGGAFSGGWGASVSSPKNANLNRVKPSYKLMLLYSTERHGEWNILVCSGESVTKHKEEK